MTNKTQINEKYNALEQEVFADLFMDEQEIQDALIQLRIARKEELSKVEEETPLDKDLVASPASNQYLQNIGVEEVVEEVVEQPVGTIPTPQEDKEAQKIVDMIMSDLASDLEEGKDIDTNLDALESAAFDVMNVVSKMKATFERVIKAKPEDAYEECYLAVKLAKRRIDGVLIKQEDVDKAMQRFQDLKELGKDAPAFEKVKAVFSLILHATGRALMKAGAFAMDITSITGIYFTRLIASLGRETKWAAIEINKAFKKRFMNA